MKWFDKLLGKFKGKSKNKLESQIARSDWNLKLVDKPGLNSLGFNLALGFDVNVDKEANINVYVNQLIFTSNGDQAKSFIENVPDDILSSTIYTLCLAAAMQVVDESKKQGFVRANVSDILSEAPPIDKSTLN